MHLAETLLLNCYRLIFATARLMNLSSLMLNGEMPDPGVPTPRMTIQPPCSETCPPPPDQPFLYRAFMSTFQCRNQVSYPKIPNYSIGNCL